VAVDHILGAAADGNTPGAVVARCHTPWEVVDGHPCLAEVGAHSLAEAVRSRAVGHSQEVADRSQAEEDVHTQKAAAFHAQAAHRLAQVAAHRQVQVALLVGGYSLAEEEVRKLLGEAVAHRSSRFLAEVVQHALVEAARRPMAEDVDGHTHRPLEKARAEVQGGLHQQGGARKLV